MRADEIKDRIREAFPAAPFNRVVTDCRCDECTDIRVELQGKRWDQVPANFIDSTFSPVLLTPEAFHSFLPAYMLRALDLLDQSDNNVVDFTVYALSPGDNEEPYDARTVEWVLNRARLMSPDQTLAVRNFLSVVAEHSPDREWLETFIRRALEEVWK